MTDKGFVCVVPMLSRGEALQVVKQFAKEVGTPSAVVSDAVTEQKSQALHKFCNETWTTLRVLQEGIRTPWANEAELHVA